MFGVGYLHRNDQGGAGTAESRPTSWDSWLLGLWSISNSDNCHIHSSYIAEMLRGGERSAGKPEKHTLHHKHFDSYTRQSSLSLSGKKSLGWKKSKQKEAKFLNRFRDLRQASMKGNTRLRKGLDVGTAPPCEERAKSFN